jgi:hypothetical protein
MPLYLKLPCDQDLKYYLRGVSFMHVNRSFRVYVHIVIIFLLITCLYAQDKQKQFESSWSSLSAYDIPEWFKDAKSGIYTHRGPYSVPAARPLGCWYPHNMYREGNEGVAFLTVFPVADEEN